MKNSCPINISKGWKISEEKYLLNNDQGLSFIANLISPNNCVISLFEAEEGLGLFAFDLMIADYNKITDELKLKKKFSMKFSQFTFPIYIIEGKNGQLFAQGFIEKEEKVYSFITFLEKAGKDYKEYVSLNPSLRDLAQLMRGAI